MHMVKIIPPNTIAYPPYSALPDPPTRHADTPVFPTNPYYISISTPLDFN